MATSSVHQGKPGGKGPLRGWNSPQAWPIGERGGGGARRLGFQGRGETRWRLREGVLAFQLPPSPAFFPAAAAVAPGEGFRTIPALLGKIPLPSQPAQSLFPAGPAAPAPALSSPAGAPITSAAGPAPPFGAPGRGRADRRAGRRAPGSGTWLLPRWRPRPQPCPLLARAGAPARPPPPPPLPGEEGEWSRHRRRRCRHGARPRGGGISPQAGSAPPASPRHLHPFPRSLLGSAGSPAERERERERGETGKNPPARVGRGSGRGGAEDRGAAAATGHRPRFGLTVAVRTRRGRGAETGLRPLRSRLSPGRARQDSRGRSGLVGKDGSPYS